MRRPPEDSEYSAADLRELNAEQWQIDLLDLNPDYCGWGPHEDYMYCPGGGWNSPQSYASWQAFGPWHLDDINECFNFYFSVDRDDDEERAHVVLVLWWGHPQKGATRGVEVRIQRDDLPSVLALLKQAADRNADRFAKVVAKADSQ